MKTNDLFNAGLDLQEKVLQYGMAVIKNTLGERSHRHCCGDCHDADQYGRWDASTDIKVQARFGEIRKVKFLVENNRSDDATIQVSAGPFIDSSGQEFDNNLVFFTPQSITLKAGESAGIEATIQVNKPHEDDKAYYTEFRVTGCPADPIKVGIFVLSNKFYDLYTLCDHCRPHQGTFIEFCDCCDCGCCEHCTRYYIAPSENASKPNRISESQSALAS